MIDTPQSCAESLWPETPSMTHREFESGFLLPQLMGALAGESAGLDLRGGCRTKSTSLRQISVWLMQNLRLAARPW